MGKQTKQKSVTLGELTIIDSDKTITFADGLSGKVIGFDLISSLLSDKLLNLKWANKHCWIFFVVHPSVSDEDIRELMFNYPQTGECVESTHINTFSRGDFCDILFGDPVSMRNLEVFAGKKNLVCLTCKDSGDKYHINQYIVFRSSPNVFLFAGITAEDTVFALRKIEK